MAAANRTGGCSDEVNGITANEVEVKRFKVDECMPGADCTATTPDEERPDKRGALRDQIVSLVQELGCKLFHDRSNQTFVTVKSVAHAENWNLSSEGFKRYIRNAWYEQHNSGLNSGVITDVVDTLDAQAIHTGEQHEIHTRVAHHEGAILLTYAIATGMPFA